MTEKMEVDEESKTAATDETAMKKSQREKGQYSYYYAWTRPEHLEGGNKDRKPVRTEVRVEQTKIDHMKPIKSFQWFDDGPRVKIYIPLTENDITEELHEDHLNLHVEETSFSFLVQREGEKSLKLNRSPLKEKIVPEKCSVRLKKKRIVISLAKKKESYKWYDLCRNNEVDYDTSDEEIPDLERADKLDEIEQDNLNALDEASAALEDDAADEPQANGTKSSDKEGETVD